MRIHESGVGLASLTAAQNPQGVDPNKPGINIGIKRMGIRPKPVGTIDVIGAPSQNPIRAPAPRENVIQVMTADRREYSRTVQNQPMGMQFNVPHEEFYTHDDSDAFNYGYEPTQDSQWEGNNQGWAPSEIKELTPMNQPPPGMNMNAPPGMGINMNAPPPLMGGPNMGGPRMPMMQNMIPPLMPMSHMKQDQDDKRDNRRMGGRDMREDSRRYDDRKRLPERSSSRERDRKPDRGMRDERPRSERDRYARESSSRRRSKSRERNKRSRSREKKRSRSKDRKIEDKDRSRSDKSKRSKKEDS
jgi:pre-mRNA 3'-end-processing factor FIP1